ncbi:MAG: amino acid ABC transporter substrate-binding protein [Nitrospinota bacterium]
MLKRGTHIFLTFLFSVTLIAASWAVFLAPDALAAKPIRIGVAISATGHYSKSGTLTLRGYKIWQKVVNEGGGLLGRPVEFVVYDDKSDPTTGARLYEKLITQDKVDLVLGPYSSAVTYPASTVTEKYHYPMIAAGSSSSKPWARGFKYLFQIMRVNTDANLGVLNLAKEQGLKTMALLWHDNPWGASIAAGTLKRAKEFGIKAVLNQKYAKGTTDFSAILTKVKALNPDLFLENGYYPDGIALFRQIKDMDINPKMLVLNFAANFPEFAEQGKDAEEVIAYSGWERFMNTPGNKEFVALNDKMFGKGRRIDAHVAYGWMGAKVLELAVKKVGSLDREKIRDAIASLEFKGILPGTFRVDKTGLQVGHEWVIIQWQKGKREINWPKEVATSEFRFPFTPWRKR